MRDSSFFRCCDTGHGRQVCAVTSCRATGATTRFKVVVDEKLLLDNGSMNYESVTVSSFLLSCSLGQSPFH